MIRNLLKRFGKKRKVLIYGLPKSGTTILTYKIASALGKSTQVIFEPKHRNRDEEKSGNIVTKCLFGLNPDTHVTPDSIKEYEDYDKKIWIARDPRDVAISNFLYQWYRGHKPIEDSFENALKKVKDKEADPTSVKFYSLDRLKIYGKVFSTEELIDHHTAINNSICDMLKSAGNDWMIFKYENLIDEEFSELNTYLGFKIDSNAEVPDRFMRVRRSKLYDNWRDWFTPEDVEFYKPLYQEYMELMKYDSTDWELSKDPVLSPELGSEYIVKLFYGGVP